LSNFKRITLIWDYSTGVQALTISAHAVLGEYRVPSSTPSLRTSQQRRVYGVWTVTVTLPVWNVPPPIAIALQILLYVGISDVSFMV
jgi:hypothetical protein